MSKYLDPKNDYIFKRIFGEHPKLLLSFLNALLPFGEDRYIAELEYLSPELVPDTPARRYSIVDVRCKDNHGRQFIVEMQNYWSSAFMQRILFNTSKAYVSQLDSSQKFNLLQPVYCVALLNEKRPPVDVETDFLHHYQFINNANPEDILSGMELLLVELPRFRPEAWKHRKLATLWLRFLREIAEQTETVDAELLSVSEIKDAVGLCEHAAYTKEQLAIYDEYLDGLRTQLSAESAKFDEGKAEGKAEGLAEGKAEGEKQKALEIARGMKAEGIPPATIAKLTGLAPAEIPKL